MTVTELVGCAFITFGPPLALFVLTIARDPLRVIIMMASAFFWLMSLLFSSLIWLAGQPGEAKPSYLYIITLIFSVICQEAFRFLFYFILRKARQGLEAVANKGHAVPKPLNMLALYYAAGLGYGVVSGAFATVNIFRDLSGPGTIGIAGDSKFFFLVSAFLALAFIFMHICWGVVFMGSLDSEVRWRQASGPIGVIIFHFIASGLTYLNYKAPGVATMPQYAVTITLSYIILFIMAAWTYVIAAGPGRALKHLVHPPTTSQPSRNHSD